MKKENIVTRKWSDRTKGKTDWARFDAMTEAEIEAAIADDPDWAGTEDIDWSKAELVEPPHKKPISIRLDEDVLDFFKREGRPTERETLISRLIDRPIRPLFVEGFRNETQVIATVLSYDLENDTDIAAMVASSAALTLSGIPFMGPIGAARVGYIDGAYVLNPTVEQQKVSALDLVVAGTQDAVLMVESEAKELSEADMLGAVTFGHQSFQPVIEAIIALAEHAAKDPWPMPEPSAEQIALKARVLTAAEWARLAKVWASWWAPPSATPAARMSRTSKTPAKLTAAEEQIVVKNVNATITHP